MLAGHAGVDVSPLGAGAATPATTGSDGSQVRVRPIRGPRIQMTTVPLVITQGG